MNHNNKSKKYLYTYIFSTSSKSSEEIIPIVRALAYISNDQRICWSCIEEN